MKKGHTPKSVCILQLITFKILIKIQMKMKNKIITSKYLKLFWKLRTGIFVFLSRNGSSLKVSYKNWRSKDLLLINKHIFHVIPNYPPKWSTQGPLPGHGGGRGLHVPAGPRHVQLPPGHLALPQVQVHIQINQFNFIDTQES